ncbi:hypothetical protein O181_053648 [Austropuccinia psidii MF-1]|uniref:Surfeit locus protein 4 n=1 Tax=Austropuccinia psidii MF-1 TaxID=1389203 RepID=A0A9Q3E4R3_9BASI|nr:hypothetical protein [Austropuccinia psidii MF-1]
MIPSPSSANQADIPLLNHQVRPLTHLPTQKSSSHINPIIESSIKSFSEKIEDWITSISQPLKPHLNKLGRLLLVLTFLEDALRIANQFQDQNAYLTEEGFSPLLAKIFLIANITLMVTCSLLIVINKWSQFSFPGLVLVILSQAIAYDLYTDSSFICLNLSILGALMLALSDTLQPAINKRAGAGLPSLSEDHLKIRQTYLQLAGRILLVVFFISHSVFAWINVAEHLTIPHILAAFFSVLACLLVAVGFKARWSALFLVIITSIVNVMSNDWWSKPKDHPERDFRRFDFFQALSVVGGMILLINQGPGGLSFDSKQKHH